MLAAAAVGVGSPAVALGVVPDPARRAAIVAVQEYHWRVGACGKRSPSGVVRCRVWCPESRWLTVEKRRRQWAVRVPRCGGGVTLRVSERDAARVGEPG